MKRLLALVLLTACGARTGVEIEAAVERDGGARDGGARDASIDGPRDAGVDATRPACPLPSEGAGFRIDALPDGPAADVTHIAMVGDGERVFLALDRTGVFTTTLVELSGRGEELARTDVFNLLGPELVLADGRLFVLGAAPDGVRVVLASGDDLEGLTSVVGDLPGGALSGWAGGWNGRELVVASDDTFEIAIGPFVTGGVVAPWATFAPSSGMRLAVDAVGGESHLLHRGGDGLLRIESFDITGAPLGIAGTVLEDVGLDGASIGVSTEDASQPWILAGHSFGDAGEARLSVRRFRRDGRATGGFSSPWPPAATTGVIALSSTPPVGHRGGYGVLAGDPTGVLFHGAGQDFVGDARSVPVDCEGDRVAIASGPCGYLLACSAGGVTTMALAVPPVPR